MIKEIATGAAFGLAIFVGADYAFSIPTVKMSNASETCVEVENYPSIFFGTTNYSCADMPQKFHHVWVQ